MKINLKKIGLMAALAFPFLGTASRATLVVNWGFDHTVYSVSPTQSIFITATVRNSPSSDEHLVTSGVGASFGGHLQFLYDFKPAGFSEFVGLDLAPGEILHFNWGQLIPIGGFVAPGTYPADPAFINFNGTITYPDNTFEVVVRPGGQPSPLPEPATLPFACALVAGVLGTALRKRNRRYLRQAAEI